MIFNYYFIYCNGFYYIVLVFCIFISFFVYFVFYKKDLNYKVWNDGFFEKVFIIFLEYKDLFFGIINMYFLFKLCLYLFIDIVL